MVRKFGMVFARDQNENENHFQKGLGAYAKKLFLRAWKNFPIFQKFTE